MRQAARWAGALIAIALLVAQGAGTEKGPVSRRTPIVEAVLQTREAIVTVTSARSGAKDMTGTGVIVDAQRGLIVTNRHVIGPNKTVSVRLHGGTILEAEVVFTDTAIDLGVVQVQTSRKLRELRPAPVSDLMVGETVIAVGHPFGYTNTRFRH
jgi:S1-C subfamily serine protease